jgi:hypothetical protein
MEGIEIGMTGALKLAKEDVDDLGLDVETLELGMGLPDTRLDLLVDVVDGLDEVPTVTLEVFDDVAETTLDEDFDEVLDEILDEVLDVALLATFEELDDSFVDGLIDEVFDGALVETFVDEAVIFLVDILLVGVETALPSTHLHSLTKSLAEYLTNGDVVLGLGPCQQRSEIL